MAEVPDPARPWDPLPGVGVLASIRAVPISRNYTSLSWQEAAEGSWLHRVGDGGQRSEPGHRYLVLADTCEGHARQSRSADMGVGLRVVTSGHCPCSPQEAVGMSSLWQRTVSREPETKGRGQMEMGTEIETQMDRQTDRQMIENRMDG